jgi:ankyrin repeat protein
LIIAANKGHHQIVSSLLAKQADVTAATNDGLTALMTASYKVRTFSARAWRMRVHSSAIVGEGSRRVCRAGS